MIKRLFWIVLILIWMCSCNNEELCLSNQHAVQTVFYSSTTFKVVSVTNLSIYGLNQPGGRTDSVYASSSVSEAFLPLSFAQDPDTTCFVFRTTNKIDTLKFVHQKELDFISGDCGYVFEFLLDTVMHSGTLVDSVSISYRKVKYGEDVENVKVYIR